uniref:Dynein regulatory complex protein 9 n=1 Tax=Percolomonas cosmopolitus TaxID=63605 RepID=A0A7S1KNK2_9EUKA|eukprot:CAMPEP_0117444122 /NCGR_PEP_ID=MMETSP0759-20121206/5066_1 /TAXON_ID=63605 /ORGANISM="Percolomonas cosmopolitus, Strain WS" /LENGTH=448 /DNA_ID=CAMNT_0005236155 /DNA_START=158 /DNA_END=1504 /DNA_ORIENTATION=-
MTSSMYLDQSSHSPSSPSATASSTHQFYLTPLESHRLTTILSSTTKKLELLTKLSDFQTIPSNGTTALDAATDSQRENGAEDSAENGTSVSHILDKTRELGSQYEHLSYERSHQTLANTSLQQSQQLSESLSQIRSQLKENTKQLCRNLKETPNEGNNWRKIKKERDELIGVLYDCRRELMSGAPTNASPNQLNSTQNQQIFYKEFVKRVSMEQSNKKYLQEILEREKETMKEVKRLQEDVKQERLLRQHEVQERTEKVTKLVADLRHLKRLNEEEKEKNRSTKTAEFECRRRLEKAQLKKLDEQLRKIRLEFDIERDVNEQTRRFLKEANKVLGTKHGEWSDTYKKESSKLQGELGTWEARRKQQLDKKGELEDVYSKELSEKNAREEKISREQKQLEEEKTKKLLEAATRIKLAYKSFKARELFELRRKESGKKKKGRKGKKKAKK